MGHGTGGDTLSVDLAGGDAQTLKDAAEALRVALAPFPEITGLEDSLPYDKSELLLELTPQGQALGFTIDGLSRDLRNRLSGVEAATFPDGIRTGRVRVELPEAERAADFLDSMMMRAEGGRMCLWGILSRCVNGRGFRQSGAKTACAW